MTRRGEEGEDVESESMSVASLITSHMPSHLHLIITLPETQVRRK